MSDRQILEEMFKRCGVVYESNDSMITVSADAGPANEGYGGFYTVFRFDADGKLLNMGAFE